MRLVRSILLSAGLGLMAVPAAADPWFLHEFGELRAYFKDWLVVCEDEGRGACRAVPGRAVFEYCTRVIIFQQWQFVLK